MAGPTSAAESQKLQLEVFINGQKTNLIGTFARFPDGRVAACRGELEELGIKAPGSGQRDEIVVLDAIAGVQYRYDERAQTIAFTLDNSQRVPHAYDAARVANGPLPVQSGLGAVLNYIFFASGGQSFERAKLAFNGVSTWFDARVFSPFGVLSQSAIAMTTGARGFDALRLDTSYTYSDPANLLTYRAGDTISGGLAWTRPIRLGGLQVQRSFQLRPDLVTAPLPSITGTAAVPSTIDVYLNNMKAFSQDVSAGPYSISNLPLLSAGEARVVLRDAAGREVETTLPFYSSPRLLRQGLWDFSVEAGFPRLNYGTLSDGYVGKAFASFSARHGLQDALTLEGHAEIGGNLWNVGAGLVARTGAFGILSLATSASRFGGDHGFQLYAAYETRLLGVFVNAASQRTFGRYDDLASVNWRPGGFMGLVSYLVPPSPRPPKALDRITISMPLSFDPSSFSLSYINLEPVSGPKSQIISASWSRPLAWSAQAFLTAFADCGERRNYGIFAGLTMPLGPRESVSAGIVSRRNRIGVTADAIRPLSPQIGSYGWRVRDSEGELTYRTAAASYRAATARIEAGIEQVDKRIRGRAEIEGGIAMIDGGVFFSNRIDDAFAVVDVGAPGVDVLYENRPIGKTNSQGMLFLPNLRAYQTNKISIDPTELPLNADIPQVKEQVVPADRSGVVVRFGVKTRAASAALIVVGADGKPLPVGAKGKIEATGETFVIGYDGRTFVKDLQSTNSIVVAVNDRECRASFPFAQSEDGQLVIGPVKCL